MPAHSALLVTVDPDDERFAGWCGVWAASQLADRPDEPPRPAGEHVALARQLLGPGGSRDGTHRAAVVDGAVVGALRLLLPTQDNPTCSTRPFDWPRSTGVPS